MISNICHTCKSQYLSVYQFICGIVNLPASMVVITLIQKKKKKKAVLLIERLQYCNALMHVEVMLEMSQKICCQMYCHTVQSFHEP